MPPIDLLFLGTGTSAGVPMIGCHCAVCSSDDPRDRRNRPSVLISYEGTRVLVDTTPELRIQCLTHHVEMIDAVVFTHGHADHIMGLDDLRRFNAMKQGPLDVWADARTQEILLRCFGYAFKEPAPEMKVYRPHLVPRMIDGRFTIGGQVWTPIPMMHGTMPVLGFRVGNLAYCTDVSYMPEESFALLEGLDVLVLDALQYRTHVTHFSVDQALEVSQRIGARQTLFTHIAHALGHAATNTGLPSNIQLAYDGQRVTAK
jgi:phosphoribosyl 1,2-cyclic phosphate phosphodiesterase